MAADPADTLAALEAGARQLDLLDRLSQRFGETLGSAFAAGSAAGRDLGGVLDGLAARMAKAVGTGAASGLEAQLRAASASLMEGLVAASFGGLRPFAAGGVIDGGAVRPFAKGGVVAAPSYFPLGGGTGLMGEAGAEAVMPLARGPDGRLGVSAPSGGATSVTVNIATPDLDGFKRSEAQVSAALARAVARGRRGL